EISQGLRTHPELRVRMGIHCGPVSQVADVNERANIAGAGINIAQRVMNCGDAGHILLSKHVAEDLQHYSEWSPYLHDVGQCEAKHGEVISIVNLYTSELGNPESPRLKRPQSEVRRRRRNALLFCRGEPGRLGRNRTPSLASRVSTQNRQVNRGAAI